MQSFRSGISTRLTTKPGVSWQRIGVLPIRSPSANAASNGSSSVSSARTISTSGISGAGLKKCMPTTRPGDDVAAAISVTESAEVLVARTASGRQILSSSAKSSRFGSSSSTIASITTSQSAKSASSVVSESRLDGVVARGLLELPLLGLAGEEVADPLARLLAELGRDLAADGVDPGLDAELRDPGTHRTEPDHPDLAHLSHGARCYLRVGGGTTAYDGLCLSVTSSRVPAPPRRRTGACVYQSQARPGD